MANYIKKEIDNFDYNKKYYVPNEHGWCFMKDDEKFGKYNKDKQDSLKPRRGRVQSDLELTGQIGPYKGEIPNNPEDEPENPKEEINIEPPTTDVWYTTSNNEVIAKFDGDADEFDAIYHTDYNSYNPEDPMIVESHTYDTTSTFKHGMATFNKDVTFMPIFNVGDEYIENIYVPKTVQYIHPASCLGLNISSIYFFSENPPVLHNGYDVEEKDVFMFDLMDSETGDVVEGANYPIYVPKNSLDAYKAAFGWSKYSERLKPIE